MNACVILSMTAIRYGHSITVKKHFGFSFRASLNVLRQIMDANPNGSGESKSALTRFYTSVYRD